MATQRPTPNLPSGARADALAGSARVRAVNPARTVRLVSGGRIGVAPTGIDEVIGAIATEQRGRVSRAQLLAAGVSRHSIDRYVRRGRLVPKHPGVYVVGHGADVDLADETAALLACGPDALLSHHSAATIWGLRRGRARPIHVTVPRGKHGVRPQGLVVHRAKSLLPCDVSTQRELPVTSPARTMLDIAAQLPERDLDYVLEEGLSKRTLNEAALAELAGRAGGHPGAGTLRRLLRDRTGSLTESVAQRRLLELIREAELPAPKTEFPLLGYRADLFWPDLRLVVEVDGYDAHGTRGAFERDRRRDARLQAAGFVVIRFTARQIEHRPLAVIAALAQAIHAQIRALAAG